MPPKNGRNFRKSDVSERQVEFWRPCRGRSPGKGFAPNSSTWLVETEISSVLEEQYFIAHTPVQIVAKMLGAFSKNIFTKMKISRSPEVRFCSEAVRMKISMCSLRSCQREVWENFSRRDRPVYVFGVMLLSLEFCSLARRFPFFFDFGDWSGVIDGSGKSFYARAPHMRCEQRDLARF